MSDEKKQDDAPPVAWEPDKPLWKGSLSSKVPVEAPDGHVALSKEEIKERDGKA